MHTIASDRIDVNTQAAERDFRLSSLTTNDALLIVRSQFNVTPQLPWLCVVYFFVRPLYSILRVLLPGQVTTSENFGRAMIRVAQRGYSSSTLESDDINAVARRD